jgi:gluconokinase
MLVLALDVGSSGARALCFDVLARPLAAAEGVVRYEPSVTPDGGVELDPDGVVDAATAAIDACLAGAGDRAREIRAVGLSVFWHSLVALGDDGRPLTGVITWADARSAPAALALGRELDAAAVHARTGAPLASIFLPAKLRWLASARPDVWRRAAHLAGFAEYLLARLAGTWRQSLSMASGTGLVDHATGAWDAEVLRACRLDAGRLPPIDDAPVPGLRPPYADRWPSLARVPWFPALGDGACSSLGSDCAGPDRLALNVGTSAAIRLVRPATSAPPPPGLWHYRVDARRSVIGGALNEGGNVLAWCRKHLALPRAEGALEAAIAAGPPGGHGLTVLPFLAGERSPGWRGDARAAVSGLGLATTAVDIARAFMEAVACRLALIHERLAPLADPGHRLVASGGALNASPAWARMVADALGAEVAISPAAQASTRGAALAALARMGAPPPPALGEATVYRPDAERHARYRELRDRQRALYDQIVGFGPDAETMGGGDR